MQKLKIIVDKLLEKKISLLEWVAVFAFSIAIRMFVEFFVAINYSLDPLENLIEYLHNFFFFLLSFLSIWLILAWLIKENPEKLAFLLAWGSLLVIFPPVLDMLKTGGEVYWSFYSLGSFKELGLQLITFFGHLPAGIVYFGSKIMFAIAILSAFVLVLGKTGKWIKAILGAFLTYVIFFLMGTFPSWLTLLYKLIQGKNIFEVKSFETAQFLSPFYPIFGIKFRNFQYSLPYNLDLVYFPLLIVVIVIFFLIYNKNKFVAVLKNFRYPQTIYLSGLFFIGMGLGFLAYPENLNINLFSILATASLLISVWLAWKASVVVNDIYDFSIDSISNPSRPLQSKIFTIREYWQLGILFFLLSILGGLVVGTKFAVILLIFQIISWFYSAPPFRLKQFPLVATLVSALASILFLFLGFSLFSGENNLTGLSARIIFLLVFSYTLCLPIKDFKDISGDKKDNIWTVPVIFGEEKGRLIVGINFFISYIASVFLLNENRLFFWALIFGGASFWVINNKKIKPYRLLWWNLFLVLFYGLILVKTVFFV